MASICAVHNKCQERFIALQHFVAAISFRGRKRAYLSPKNAMIHKELRYRS